MGKLLTILGISEDKQLRLPKKILQAEKIIAGLQGIYSQSPESNKKNVLADTIAEATRLLLAEINNTKLEQPKEQPIELPNEEPKKEIEINIGDTYQAKLDDFTWLGVVRKIEELPTGKTIVWIETMQTNVIDPFTKQTVIQSLESGNWVKLEKPQENQKVPKEEKPQDKPKKQKAQEEKPQEQPKEEKKPQKQKRKSKKQESEPNSPYPENNDYENWSQEQLNAKRNEILETIAFFEQNGIDTEELQIELDEINLYIN